MFLTHTNIKSFETYQETGLKRLKISHALTRQDWASEDAVSSPVEILSGGVLVSLPEGKGLVEIVMALISEV